MTHPDWALKYKQKGTELRNIRGKYYLYRISSKYDKERKVTRKITHEMLGRITEEEGFIPRGQKKRKEPKPLPPVSVKEYGATKFLSTIGKDILEELQKAFPQLWQSIAVLAMNRLIYQSPLKNNQLLYNESFLTESMPYLSLDKNTLTALMQHLGGSRDQIVSFLSKFTAGEKNIIFDATHIFSGSKQCKMSGVGYNSKKDFDPQINLFYMFSVEKQQPLYYRVFPGNVSGVKALKLSMQESGASHCTVVGDKGFASDANFKLLENEKLSYIFPLKRDSALISYERLKLREYEKAYDGHFLYHNRPIFYYTLKSDGDRTVIVFFDASLKVDEESSYLRRVNEKVEGYHMQGYQQKQLRFGTISMVTNTKKPNPEEIYISYKHRMEIETLFDSYKNLLDADRSYMHSDKSFEAWAFINHIATLFYYRIFNLIKTHNKLSSISPQDLLLKLTKVFKIKIKDQWHLAEVNSKFLKLFQSLGISVT